MTRALCSVENCGGALLAKGLCSKHYQRLKLTGSLITTNAEPGAPLNFLERMVGYAGRECVIWPYGRDRNGYGMLRHKGQGRTASRVMCELAHGAPDQHDAEAAHSCGRGRDGCVNPNHLRWKTHAENMAEAVEHGAMVRGEAHYRAKLSEDQVLKIRNDRRAQKDIAACFAISLALVSRIKSGKRWAWLTEDREVA